MILFAHHVEPQHVPVLVIFLVVGIWLGWRVTSRLVRWREKSKEVYTPG